MPEIDATPNPDAPNGGGSEATAARKRGAQPQNSNALKSGRRCAKLPHDCKYIEPRLRRAKLEIEDALLPQYDGELPGPVQDQVLLALDHLRKGLIAEKRAREEKNPRRQYRWYELAGADRERYIAELRRLGVLPPTTTDAGGRTTPTIQIFIPHNGRGPLPSNAVHASELPPMPQLDSDHQPAPATQQNAANAFTTQIPFFRPSVN